MRRLLLIALVVTACSDDDTPPDHVNAATTALTQYASCDSLEADLKQQLIYEVNADIDNVGEYGLEDTAGGTAGGDASSGGGRTEGVDYSGTNNQETGVDEGDLVKSDGYHLYALNGNRLHIFGTPNFGDLVPESVTQIEGHPREMLMDKDSNRVVVFSMIDVYSLPDGHPLKQLVGWQDNGWYWRISQLTKITVLDVSNRTAPALVREVYFEGWYDTARKVDSTVRMAAYSWLSLPWVYNWWNVYDTNGHDKDETKQIMHQRINALHLSDLIPQMYVRTPNGQFVTNSLSSQSCRSFYRPTDSHARGLASIISFDLLGTNFFWDADHVVANWPTFYESQDRIVIAESAQDWWWYYWFRDDAEQTNLHVFDSSQAGATAYLGSGRIEGSVWSSFNLDEQNGDIRVAATSGGWWHFDTEAPDPIENHIYVLAQPAPGQHFATVGHIDGITIGERITAARFLGNQAFLTTYRYVDPLVTIDLSDRTHPHVQGELVVPGYSTYLHPMGDHGLLSIGMSSDWGTTNISMFDVGNPAAPALTTNLALAQPDGWSWSEALWDHKAFQYWEPKGLLAIPSSNYISSNNSYRYLSKLELIKVDPVNGALSLHGEIDHSAYYNNDQGWWLYTDIRRAVFMGDFVYAISDKAITAHRTEDLAQVNVALLPGYTEGDWYWWW